VFGIGVKVFICGAIFSMMEEDSSEV